MPSTQLRIKKSKLPTYQVFSLICLVCEWMLFFLNVEYRAKIERKCFEVLHDKDSQDFEERKITPNCSLDKVWNKQYCSRSWKISRIQAFVWLFSNSRYCIAQRRSEKQYTGQSDIYREVLITNKLVKFYSFLTTELCNTVKFKLYSVFQETCHQIYILLVTEK